MGFTGFKNKLSGVIRVSRVMQKIGGKTGAYRGSGRELKEGRAKGVLRAEDPVHEMGARVIRRKVEGEKGVEHRFVEIAIPLEKGLTEGAQKERLTEKGGDFVFEPGAVNRGGGRRAGFDQMGEESIFVKECGPFGAIVEIGKRRGKGKD